MADDYLNPDTAGDENYPADFSGVINKLSDLLEELQDQPSDGTDWSYVAASGGITDTTAVPLKAAAGADIKIYLQTLTISNGGAAGTAFVINSDTGGSAVPIYRGYVGAGAAPVVITFRKPLETAANKRLEIVLASGTTVAVYVHATGYTR
jgi:hypothetical protein